MNNFETLSRAYVNFDRVLDTFEEHFNINPKVMDFLKLLLVASARKGSLEFSLNDKELAEIAQEITVKSKVSDSTIGRKRRRLRDYIQSRESVASVDVFQSTTYFTYDLSGLSKVVNWAFDKVQEDSGINITSYVLINPSIRQMFIDGLIEGASKFPRPRYVESPQALSKRK